MSKEDQELIEALASFAGDPVGFVHFAFPWGEPGPLEEAGGLAEWQLKVLLHIRDNLVPPEDAIRIAVSSGHGVGKSALVSMLILWAFTTRPDTRGIITANTEAQLRTKTWAEFGKWFNLFIGKHLFELTATTFLPKDPARQRTWRIDAVAWSKDRPEAFAGLHNQGNRILVIFDEASGIDDAIWETTEGALTDRDTEIIWCVFGNPSRPEGWFKECFPPAGRFCKMWKTLRVDARSIPWTNKELIARWIEAHGLDSDFVRVRVLGEFPTAATESFIPETLAREAAERPDIHQDPPPPLILGVDVARQGEDFSVLWARRGRDARSIMPRVYQTADTMQIVQKVMEFAQDHHPAAIAVDATGYGAGVADRLRELGLPIYDVNFGTRPVQSKGQYANRRAEIWGLMKEWLKKGTIPEKVPGMDWTIPQDLALPTYHIIDSGRSGIELESKSRIKSRAGRSPDLADALACTFAVPGALLEYSQLAQTNPAALAQSGPPRYNPLTARNFQRF